MRTLHTLCTCALLSSLLVACGGATPVVAPKNDDTLEAHARAQDDEGLKRATAALASKASADRLRGLRAMLEYEPVKLAGALDAITQRALHADDANEKAAAAWALVHAGDARACATALALFDSGALARATKLDGSNAFDVAVFARLLVAEAVPAELRDSRRKVIASALEAADKKARPLLVRALTEDAEDGTTLVTAAESLDAQTDFTVLEHVFQRLRALADPRAANALAHYADHAQSPHFRTEAALRLAELGDMRAAPHLAWRLGEDPLKLYDASDPSVLAYRRDDRERVASARMLAELAMLHPEALAQLREMVTEPVMAWTHDHPEPHANAMRLLALVESPRAVPLLKSWADPTAALPTSQTEAFPTAFATAQSALRYLGRTHDASAFAILSKQLGRKPATFDASIDALSSAKAGGAIAGMVFRALAYGAAEGFSELGDVKAVPLLVKVADDAKQNEQARVALCAAAAYLADARARSEIVATLRASATDRKREFSRSCWLAGLSQKPSAREDAPLVALLAPKVDPESRHQAARLLGQGALAAPDRNKLLELAKERALVHDAALALLFGGDDESVAKVFAAYEPKDDDTPAPPIEPLRQLYAQSIPPLTEDFYDSGALARFVSLAMSARNVTVRSAKQEWVLQSLAYQLRQSGELDTGPHTLTRVRLRQRLLADAKSSDTKKRDGALHILWALGERASLASLGAPVTEPSP